VGLALRHFGVVLVGGHSGPLSATRKDPSRVGQRRDAYPVGPSMWRAPAARTRATGRAQRGRLTLVEPNSAVGCDGCVP
jgi:hypothetical protein